MLALAAAIVSSRTAAAAPADGLLARTAPNGTASLSANAVLAPSSLGVASMRPLPALDPPPAVAPPAVAPPAPEREAAPALARVAAGVLNSPAAVVGRLGVSRQGRQLRAQVTAYSASVEEGTAWGITRSGTRARPGVVAVDPAVIPLGSRVRIAGLAGVFRAEDTGGGIHGAHLDVFMESRAEALRFGRQTSVLVEVLE